jgi:hypothetical protein
MRSVYKNFTRPQVIRGTLLILLSTAIVYTLFCVNGFSIALPTSVEETSTSVEETCFHRQQLPERNDYGYMREEKQKIAILLTMHSMGPKLAYQKNIE